MFPGPIWYLPFMPGHILLCCLGAEGYAGHLEILVCIAFLFFFFKFLHSLNVILIL